MHMHMHNMHMHMHMQSYHHHLLTRCSMAASRPGSATKTTSASRRMITAWAAAGYTAGELTEPLLIH
jgi:hypothetical protein